MSNENLLFFEQRITEEIKEIEERIRELETTKMVLARQLAKAKRDGTGLLKTPRKNSHNRILAENSVIETLKKTQKAVSTGKLYLAAKETNYDLKENTFRSYLHRMKKRELIKSSRRLARHWVLPDNNEDTS